MNPIIVRRYESPCGELLIGSSGGRICLCDWGHAAHHEPTLRRLQRTLEAEIIVGESAVNDATIAQLGEYFEGARRAFVLPLMAVGTDFQKAVWRALLTVDYGSLCSYARLAAMIGRPQSVRAVANAVGANPMSIIVPCHRIIGADGRLTGYAGGLAAKARLLELENGAGLQQKNY